MLKLLAVILILIGIVLIMIFLRPYTLLFWGLLLIGIGILAGSSNDDLFFFTF